MTEAQRQTVRAARDRVTREGIAWESVARCSECGGELRDDFDRPLYVSGCPTCSERRWKHERRAREQSELARLASVQLDLVAGFDLTPDGVLAP